jgi:DNA-binding response OmpR family regulator
MSVKVPLSEILDHLETMTDESAAYLHKPTGEVVLLSDEEMNAAKENRDSQAFEDWQWELIEKAREVLDSDEYLLLPEKFDVHEYKIMESFCVSPQAGEHREELTQAIRGDDEFSRFKQAIARLDIEESWFRFRDEAMEKIATDWLEENGIGYER